MFLDKSSTKDSVTSTAGTLAARARTAGTTAAAAAAQNAAVAAQTAAQHASAAAQHAAQNASAAAQHAAHDMGSRAQVAAAGMSGEVKRGVRQGVFSARSWAAPQLENAADYCTATVAPKVSDALRACARQVRPQRKASKRSAVAWTLLGTAVVAALGAAGAVLKHRAKSAAAGADTDTGAAAAASGDADDTTASPDQPAPDSTANGRVSANDW